MYRFFLITYTYTWPFQQGHIYITYIEKKIIFITIVTDYMNSFNTKASF